MRGAFLPLLCVAELPVNTSTAALTRGLVPFWNIPCSYDEIAKWCFRVKQWKMVITTPVDAYGEGGVALPYTFVAQAGGDERNFCFPAYAEEINPDGTQGGDYTVVRQGFGGYFNTGPNVDYALELAIGPSTAERISGFPIPYGDLLGGCRIVRDFTIPDSAMLFSVLLNFHTMLPDGTSCVMTSFGTEESDRIPLIKNWTTSVCSFTFCGHTLPMYYQSKGGGTSDFVGAGANGSIEIMPDTDSGSAYYEWREADGTLPIYDVTTGATLITPVPFYPPR